MAYHFFQSPLANHKEHATTILSHLSYAALLPEEQQVVEDLFEKFSQADTEHNCLKAAFKGLSVEVFRKKQTLSEAINCYLQKLNTINPATISMLDDSQQKATHQELLFGFYLLSAQFYLCEIENNKQFLKSIAERLHQTTNLIHLIHCNKTKSPKAILARELSDSENLCKYLSIPLGHALAKEVMQFADSQIDTVESYMNAFNERRLFWVWGEDVVNALFRLLPDSFRNKNQAQATLHAPDGILGAVGWSLYYTRFAIELGLLLKHTLTGSWMSKDEALIPAYERFSSQWQQRKFLMLNDLAWATVNLVTYFWLVGRGLLGYWGDVITVSLLFFDASVTLWRYFEVSTEQNQLIQRMENDILLIQNKLAHANDTDKHKLKYQLDALIAQKSKQERDWQYKKYQLVLDVTYALTLIGTYAMACSFLVPAHLLHPMTSFVLGITGSVFCLAITIGYTLISGVIEINQTNHHAQDIKKSADAICQQFKNEPNPEVRQLLYLDIMHLFSQCEDQHQVIAHQKRELMRKVLVDAMIPGIVFSALLFCSTGIGIATIAVSITLIALSKFMLAKYQPKACEAPDFDERAYLDFSNNPSIETIESSIKEQKHHINLFETKKTQDEKLTEHMSGYEACLPS